MIILNRDTTIDRLRGIAIMCMFYAHLIPHYVANGVKLLFIERVFCSLAAPLFLFLVGYNFNPKHTSKRVFKRILVIFMLAVGIDLFVWGIFPFYSFDVLYLIGTSILFLYFFRNIDKFKFLILVLIALIFAIVLQYFKAYSIDLYEPYLNQNYKIKHIFYNFFVNGWFPFFPWIIFPILGFIFKYIKLKSSLHKLFSFLFFVFIVFIVFQFNFNSRPFSVEIFYPPTWIYLLLAFAYLYFVWSNKIFLKYRIFYFLNDFGKLSLFLYVFHLSIYQYVGEYLIRHVENRVYCFAIFLFFFWIVAFSINKLKQRFIIFQKSELLRLFFGS